MIKLKHANDFDSIDVTKKYFEAQLDGLTIGIILANHNRDKERRRIGWDASQSCE